MTNNLNDNLYRRFGLELQIEEVRRGFSHYVKNLIDDKLGPIRHPDGYKDHEELQKIQRSVLSQSCREMFLDFSKYNDWNFGFGWFLDEVFKTNFSEILVRLQILINLIHKHSFIKVELEQFIEEINNHLSDFPVLGLIIKTYKARAPQLLPITSKKFEEVMRDTLGLLDSSGKYKDVLNYYEDGLKEFLTANTQAQLKDVVEDMYTSVDVLIQVITGNHKAGLRNVFVGKPLVNAGLNKWQLKIFDEMKKWMDKIKHGAEDNFTKIDIETIIILASQFIRIVVNNKTK